MTTLSLFSPDEVWKCGQFTYSLPCSCLVYINNTIITGGWHYKLANPIGFSLLLQYTNAWWVCISSIYQEPIRRQIYYSLAFLGDTRHYPAYVHAPARTYTSGASRQNPPLSIKPRAGGYYSFKPLSLKDSLILSELRKRSALTNSLLLNSYWTIERFSRLSKNRAGIWAGFEQWVELCFRITRCDYLITLNIEFIVL